MRGRAIRLLSALAEQGQAIAPRQAGKRARRVVAYNIRAPVPYVLAWRLQQALMAQRIAWQKEGREGFDILLLLEHPSVYTLGRSAKVEDVKFDMDDNQGNHEVHRIDRGGKVTWHGPGQVVLYPILDLNYHRKDLRWYVRQLEEVVIRVLGKYGVQGGRDDEHTGVWVDNAKVAAIGMNASRWVTIHGLALNVEPDLTAFDRIVPCGIRDRQVTSLARLLAGEAVSADGVRSALLSTFQELFPDVEMRVLERDEAPALEQSVAEVEELWRAEQEGLQ